VNIQNVRFPVAHMQAWRRICAPLVNAIVSNALFHFNSHIYQMLPQWPDLLSSFVLQDFIIN